MKFSFHGNKMIVTVKSEFYSIMDARKILEEFENLGWLETGHENDGMGNRVYYYDYVED